MSDWTKLRSESLMKERSSIMDKYKGGMIPMPKTIKIRIQKLDRLIDKLIDKEFGIK